jgi:hypothetical protein
VFYVYDTTLGINMKGEDMRFKKAGGREVCRKKDERAGVDVRKQPG